MYNKRLTARITSGGTVNISNITHCDEITFAVRQVVDSIRAVGESMLKSSSSTYGLLAPEPQKRADRFLSTIAHDVDIRNIAAQTYLPGYVNTVKMQEQCNAQLEPNFHDQSALCELKRSLLPSWYGKKPCVCVRSTGMISLTGLRSFQAVDLCVKKACALARNFICPPPPNVCKNINERLKLGPLVREIDTATMIAPVQPEKIVDDGEKDADAYDDDDGWLLPPVPTRTTSTRISTNWPGVCLHRLVCAGFVFRLKQKL